jgi:hypothetical protein
MLLSIPMLSLVGRNLYLTQPLFHLPPFIGELANRLGRSARAERGYTFSAADAAAATTPAGRPPQSDSIVHHSATYVTSADIDPVFADAHTTILVARMLADRRGLAEGAASVRLPPAHAR